MFQRKNPIITFWVTEYTPTRSMTKQHSFYSSLPAQQWVDVLKSELELQSKGDHKIKIIIRDHHMNKSSSRTRTLGITGQYLFDQFKQKVTDHPKTWDLKKTLYTVFITNETTQNYDSRSFSFHSKLTKEKVYEKLHERVKKVVRKEQSRAIIFFDEKKKKRKFTHYIKLVSDGRKSQSFGIILPNYSSEELRGLIQDG